MKITHIAIALIAALALPAFAQNILYKYEILKVDHGAEHQVAAGEISGVHGNPVTVSNLSSFELLTGWTLKDGESQPQFTTQSQGFELDLMQVSGIEFPKDVHAVRVTFKHVEAQPGTVFQARGLPVQLADSRIRTYSNTVQLTPGKPGEITLFGNNQDSENILLKLTILPSEVVGRISSSRQARTAQILVRD
jgi:hypothetical protein